MQEPGLPLQSGPAPAPAPGDDAPAVAEAKTENFFSRRVEPHCGQRVPFQSEERTRISLSARQVVQWNS